VRLAVRRALSRPVDDAVPGTDTPGNVMILRRQRLRRAAESRWVTCLGDRVGAGAGVQPGRGRRSGRSGPGASRRSAADPSAICQLVLPGTALGYHGKTDTRLVTEAGGTWSRYAPGDHSR
jgi:hypothetical protein